MFAVGDLSFIGFPALGDDDIIVLLAGDGFDTIDHLGEEIVVNIADDDPDGFAEPTFEALGDGVGLVVVFAGIGKDQSFGFLADLMAAAQGL